MTPTQVFTDASFDEKAHVSGVGIVIVRGEKRSIYSAFFSSRSSNEGELQAIWLASQILHGEAFELYTDSQAALIFLEGKENSAKARTSEGWKNFLACKLWAKKIQKSSALAQTSLHLLKIKGHQKSLSSPLVCNNRLADLLAKEGLGKYYLQNKFRQRPGNSLDR